MIVIVIVAVVVIVIVIICNEYMYISSCLLLSCLVSPCPEWTSITTVIIGMTLYELVLHYHIILYRILCFFILSLLLIWSPFYSILFNFHSILLYSTLFQIDSIWFDSILFYWIWFTVLFSIVSHINERFVYLSVHLCVCLFVYLYE